MDNSRNACRDGLSGKKRQARRDARASVSEPPSTAAAILSSTVLFRAKGRKKREQSERVQRQTCDNKRRLKRKEEMSEKERSIKSTQFLWDRVRTTLYCFVSYETDNDTKKQIQHCNMQRTYTGVRSQTTAKCIYSFIRTDAIKLFSTMILCNTEALIMLYIYICDFQENYSETWRIVKEENFKDVSCKK